MKASVRSVIAWMCAVAGLGGAVSTQDQATTLSAMVAEAAHVARVRVLATSGGAERRVTFLTLESLRGDAPRTFTLSEPEGGACGRALSGLAVGAGYILFLGDGPSLAFRTSRAVVALEPGLVDHVTALCAVRGDATATTTVLANSLTSANERIRRDAALALAIRPDIERAGAATVAALRDALERALRERDERLALPLVTAATRTGDRSVLDLVLDHRGRSGSAPIDRALASSVRRFPATPRLAAPEQRGDAPPVFRSIRPHRASHGGHR